MYRRADCRRPCNSRMRCFDVDASTRREAKHANGQHRDCEQCYTRFRYSADIGAIYWNVWQIQKKCVEPGTPCNNTACYCTVDAPYYQGELHIPDGNGGYTIQNGSQYCSVWAKSACRRKVFKCVFHLADYVVTTFQDYEIKFCSIGPDTPECSGCVACKHDDCLYPVIHASKAIDPKTGSFASSALVFPCRSFSLLIPPRCSSPVVAGLSSSPAFPVLVVNLLCRLQECLQLQLQHGALRGSSSHMLERGQGCYYRHRVLTAMPDLHLYG